MCGGFSQSRGYNHQHGQDTGELPPGFSSCPPTETYKVEVFRYPQLPWETTGRESHCPEIKIIPRNILIWDLMQNKLCLNNSNASKNIVIQLVRRNYNQFTKKMEFRGDDSEKMKMRLFDLEENRDRSSGQPDMWIWVSDSGMH